jgi:hypothetical protein
MFIVSVLCLITSRSRIFCNSHHVGNMNIDESCLWIGAVFGLWVILRVDKRRRAGS